MTTNRIFPLKSNSLISIPNISTTSVMRIVFYTLCCAVLINLGESLTGNDSATFELLSTHSVLYFLMGIVAATIANSTGAGGGIVFLPVFIILGFTPLESLATSIAIQCFGMSSGALAWISYRSEEQKTYPEQWQHFYVMLIIAMLASCTAIQLTQRFMAHPPIDIELLFAFFSFAVGAYILIRTLYLKSNSEGRSNKLLAWELVGLVFISFVGGVITSWISVGVGELLLIYLLAIGVRLNIAVAIAVCVSAISVLAAIPYFISAQAVSLEVLVFAAPGALIGGFIARHLATYLGAQKLKIAASTWIILSSLPYLIFGMN